MRRRQKLGGNSQHQSHSEHWRRSAHNLLSALRVKASPVRFVIVGPREPDKADALDEGLIDRAVVDGVVFAGLRTDMPECYAAMDLFLTASWREGFPRSAMEAAAMGLPTVASDIRGNRQVIDDDVTGTLVPVRDASAFATAVHRLATEPETRQRMSAAAHLRAADHFDQAQVIARTLEAYGR